MYAIFKEVPGRWVPYDVTYTSNFQHMLTALDQGRGVAEGYWSEGMHSTWHPVRVLTKLPSRR